MDATQLIGASADESFIYKRYANGRTEKTPRRGSGGVIRVSPDLEARREPVVVSRPVSFGDLSRRSSSLDARLDALESRARKFEEQKPTGDEQTAGAWVKDMQALAEGDYSARQEVYKRAQDSNLTPAQARVAQKEEQEDEAWLNEMATLVGDDYPKKKKIWERGQ